MVAIVDNRSTEVSGMVKRSRILLSLPAFTLLAAVVMLALSGPATCSAVTEASGSPDGYCTLYYGLQSETSGIVGDANVTLCQMVPDTGSMTGYDLVPLGIPGNPLNAANFIQSGDPFFMFRNVPYLLPFTRYTVIVERNGRIWNGTIMAGPYNTECIPILQVDDSDNVIPAIASLDNTTIYGWTRDLDGNNVAGVTVTLMRQNGYASISALATDISPNPVKSATGGNAGFYCFRNVTPAWYTITVEKDSRKYYDTFNFRGNDAEGFEHNLMLLYETSGIERAVDAMPDVPDLSDSSLYNASAINSTGSGSWTASLNETIRTITSDGAGGLFAFGRDTVYRLGGDGNLLWRLDIPSQWRLSSEYWRVEGSTADYIGFARVAAEPIYDVSNGNLYLYLTPAAPYPNMGNNFDYTLYAGSAGLNWSVMAVSPEGQVAWTLPLTTDREYVDATAIRAAGDRIYIFHDYTETVVDGRGTVLFTLRDVSDPASVDERGNVYVVRASPQGEGNGVRVYYDQYGNPYLPDYRIPSSVIEAYDAGGTLLWSQGLANNYGAENLVRQYIAEDIRPQFSALPLYQNGTLYAPVDNGIMALDTNGTVKWFACPGGGSFKLYEHMPLDGDGNVYLVYDDGHMSQGETWLYMVSDGGKKIIGPRKYSELYDGTSRPAARDGIVYYILTRNIDYNLPLENMPYAIAVAYDIRNDTILWAYKIAPGPEHEMVINANNSKEVTDFVDPDEPTDILLGTAPGAYASYGPANEVAFAGVYPAGDRIYVSFRAIKYEFPVTFNVSRAVYASDIYVLNVSGQPVQRIDTGSLVTAVAVNNSTFYYTTIGGKVMGSMSSAPGIVAGIVLLATMALATKMLLAAAVARARSRVNKNENRNLTMAYIRGHPGSTLYEISRGMGMNLGTIRYHVFILGMNHKITSFSDGKFIRHFPNSNCYTRDEQLIISLLRREPMKDIIRTLRAWPGLTNAEIARATCQNYSSISKFLKELCGKGILIREDTDGSSSYRISEKYASLLAGLASKVETDELLADSLRAAVSGSRSRPSQ
jgi:predicted transcriptional regulator